jgi:hypothetical protein
MKSGCLSSGMTPGKRISEGKLALFVAKDSDHNLCDNMVQISGQFSLRLNLRIANCNFSTEDHDFRQIFVEIA